MQNLISKENTAATLASIGVEEAISHNDAVTVQELDANSSDGESNDGPSDWELEEDEKVSLLSDEEDEEATGGEVAADQTMDEKVTQAPKPDKSTEETLMNLLMMKTSSLVMITRRRGARNVTIY